LVARVDAVDEFKPAAIVVLLLSGNEPLASINDRARNTIGTTTVAVKS
tara:strand:- start:76 stop:219 length:144 start_codon:yes stop_codon:yes gene_type:complete